jgi:hypothetical protein
MLLDDLPERVLERALDHLVRIGQRIIFVWLRSYALYLAIALAPGKPSDDDFIHRDVLFEAASGLFLHPHRLAITRKRATDRREGGSAIVEFIVLYGWTVPLSMTFRSGESGCGTCTPW